MYLRSRSAQDIDVLAVLDFPDHIFYDFSIATARRKIDLFFIFDCKAWFFMQQNHALFYLLKHLVVAQVFKNYPISSKGAPFIMWMYYRFGCTYAKKGFINDEGSNRKISIQWTYNCVTEDSVDVTQLCSPIPISGFSAINAHAALVMTQLDDIKAPPQ